ncbi:conserved hypothetical protein [Gammaproteobacteria bacterium]
MNKRDFIQRAAIHYLPVVDQPWNLDRAIHYAERLWERLTERGYGNLNKRGPNPAEEDWYGKLQGESRKHFDAFWRAFNYKHGRNGAAMRWAQIDPDVEVAKKIIEAARLEAQRPLPNGQVRKFAQGWLSERRWEDCVTPAATDPGISENIRARELMQELAHLRVLHQTHPNERLAAQIAVLEAKLKGEK